MKHVIALVIGITFTLAALHADAATRIVDPAGFVRAVYARLAKDQDYNPPEDIYSPRLAALWAGERRDAGGEVGRIDFDFWINAQDGQPKDVQISASAVEGRSDRRIVIAKFDHDDSPRKEEIRFYFERTAGVWKLDDVVSTGPSGSQAWTLSVILKYGWPG